MKYYNLSHSVNTLYRKFSMIIGKFNYILAKWWGVKIKSECNFFGKITFKRYPNSIISIGSKCTFLSKNDANLIGINRPCIISTQTRDAVVDIGSNCGFSGTVIGAFKSIKLSDNVRCGANTLITDSDWHPDDNRSGEAADVIIESNVWLGEGVKVLKGVRIGENSLIGANSVVVKSIPANVIAAGNPCKVIKEINR